jgi:glycosyltransferase involved in cell wall biosynthesis
MKFSIITATYNCESIILNALDSINKQTYQNIEHIVIDGCSEDRTLQILKNHKSKISVLISEKDSGIYDALNKGIVNSTGDVIAVLHSDDFFAYDNVVSDVAKIFKNNPKLSIVIGNVEYIDNVKSNKILRTYKSNNFRIWMLRFGFMPAHTASFIRKELFDTVGLYSTKYKIAGDFEFFVRSLLHHKMQFVVINKVLVCMRAGGVSSSGIGSYWKSTIEIKDALISNNVNSNIIFILVRLPIKWVKMVWSNYVAFVVKLLQ